MNTLMRFFTTKALVWSFTLITCMLQFSCKKGFDEYYGNAQPKGGYLYEKLKKNENFTLFAQALERADLVSFLDKGGLYTVFAPTNDAVKKYLAQNNYSGIDQVPVPTLFQMLSYHIVNNMWYHYDLKLRFKTYNQKLYLTRNKKFVSIDVTAADTIRVNNVPVIGSLKDIDADNGVIHGISEMLIPLPNLEQMLQADPALSGSTFYKLMQVLADSAFDRFNSYDVDRDGRFDSMFYKTYPLIDLISTSLEYKINTLPQNQGGDPVFTTILMPSNEAFNPLIQPALLKNGNDLKAISPTYAEALLESYFLYDTLRTYTSAELIARPKELRSVNQAIVPALTADKFIRKDIMASNGGVQVINTTFPATDRQKSAMGQAAIEPDLTMFMAAVQSAGLMNTIASSTRSGTYFAPTNTAFIEAGLDVKKRSLNGVSLTQTEFNNIVKNLILDQSLAPAALTGSIATNLGAGYPLVFTNNGGLITVTSSGGSVGAVTLPQLYTGPSNVGYVYKINKILLPKP